VYRNTLDTLVYSIVDSGVTITSTCWKRQWSHTHDNKLPFASTSCFQLAGFLKACWFRFVASKIAGVNGHLVRRLLNTVRAAYTYVHNDVCMRSLKRLNGWIIISLSEFICNSKLHYAVCCIMRSKGYRQVHRVHWLRHPVRAAKLFVGCFGVCLSVCLSA